MAESYRYFAFISYSSKDVAVSKRLQKKIESYKLPTIIRKKIKQNCGVEFPKRLCPIFRDVPDLLPSVLATSLLCELKNSKYLIVICSHNSVQSDWVNREVEEFILMGGYERIIPYIIDGEGNSKDPSREAFPPILRRKREYISYEDLTPEENAERQEKLRKILAGQGEIKGVSTLQEGEWVARIKIIARMLDIEKEDLVKREWQRIRQQRRISALLLFLVMFFSLFIWDKYYRTHVAYYADYVERRGVPEGIFPLAKEQVAKRQFHYRIETKAGLVQRLVHANSAGTPVPHNSELLWNSENLDRPMIMNYFYDSSTKNPATKKPYLLKAIIKNRYHKELITYRYTFGKDTYLVERLLPDDGTIFIPLNSISTLINHDNSISFQNSNIPTVQYKTDNKGFVKSVLYMKSNNKGDYTTDVNALSGMEYERYEDGRIKAVKFLSQNGSTDGNSSFKYVRRCVHDEENQKTSFYEAQRLYEYDKKSGNLEWVTCTDLAGVPIENQQGWKVQHYIYNEEGNFRTIHHLKGDRKTIEPQTVIIECEYNTKGNPVKELFFDSNHQPIEDAKVALAQVVRHFNALGDIDSVSYFTYSVKEKKYIPCECSAGCAHYEATCNEFGDQVESRYFGVDGKPCLRKEGNARFVAQYDKFGNCTKQTYYGLDGKLCMLKAGYAGFTATFDQTTGKPLTYRYWDKDGKTCMSNVDGCAQVVFDYSLNEGLLKSMKFLDKDNNLCDSNCGCALITKTKLENCYSITTYDSKNRPLSEKYQTLNGEPTYLQDGSDLITPLSHFRKNFYYDDETGVKSITYYDICQFEGKERSSFGYSQIRYWYNAKDENIQIDYLDANDNLVSGPNEYARIITKYGNDGEITSVSYYDKDENPFDVLMLEDEDIDDERYWQKQITKVENGYIQTDYYATEKTSLMRDDVSHRVVITDKDGREVCVKFYDKDNKPCEKCDSMVQTEYENLEQYGSGIASVESRFDWNNNLVERSFYDKNEKLCRDNHGVAKHMWKYDNSNRTILFQYYDEKAVVCENNEGICSIEWEYDKNISPNGAVICPVLCKKCNIQGRVLEERYYDKKGQPWYYRGISGFRNEFLQDSNNVKIKQILIDAQGKPTSDVDGVAWILQTYDSDGEMISQQPYNIDGNPCSFQNFPSLPSLIFDEKGKPMGTE